MVADIRSGGGRPKAGYRLESGARVPSVTTVLSRVKESGPLIHWGWALGMEGRDYRKVRDDAADAGHLSHAMVEAHLRGAEYDPPADTDEALITMAEQALESFRRWEATTAVEWLHIEWPMVSELLRFGGTADGIAIAGGELVVSDLKSGNRIYPEVIAQCAAYAKLYEETAGRPVTGAYVIRIGKEVCSFASHYFPQKALDVGWEFFRNALRLYDLDKQLKKVSGL